MKQITMQPDRQTKQPDIDVRRLTEYELIESARWRQDHQ